MHSSRISAGKRFARDAGVKMPSFFGYVLWSGTILLPILLAIAVVPFTVTA